MIANHIAASLSELDKWIGRSVPPGGNWRNVPVEVPSQRIAQIRVSAAAGEGSRSTYYGRLDPNHPSYTINTYYSRPGNGCHLHYEQNRTLSHREAARLQSFPDSFEFTGKSHRAVSQQIGNAVPPLLAYQLAQALGPTGQMVDVFSGAGGLSLGFEWAGWRSLVATDFDKNAVATFNRNIEPVSFVGDMTSDDTLETLAKAAAHRTGRLAVIGGPPCQGFSTGGNRRSTHDQRNWLFKRYVALLVKVRPDLVVFENVLGLLSMEGGSFVKEVVGDIASAGYEVRLERLNAADFGVPQRRNRIFIVGVPKGQSVPEFPKPWTTTMDQRTSSMSALSDLPKIDAGSDGSSQPYATPPESTYQKLMRGECSPLEFIDIRRRQVDDTNRQPSNIQLSLGLSKQI